MYVGTVDKILWEPAARFIPTHPLLHAVLNMLEYDLSPVLTGFLQLAPS